MNAVLAAMCKRRSIRKYTGDNVTAEQIEAVLQAGLLAPSSQDRRPCWFVVVRNRELLDGRAKPRLRRPPYPSFPRSRL